MTIKAEDLQFIKEVQCKEHCDLVKRVNIILYIVIGNMVLHFLTVEQTLTVFAGVSKLIF